MNRVVPVVIAGGFGNEGSTPRHRGRRATEITAEEVAELLGERLSVSSRPGYGMAVAHAQYRSPS
jgi:NAD(P) transhydrogenase subunit beta